MKTTHLAWIAADWGTTNLRVWGLSAENEVVVSAKSDKGMSALTSDQFEPALLELVSEWLPSGARTLVVACGMVGARQGWVEAAYVDIPSSPVTSQSFEKAPTTDPRLKVLIVPGLSQKDPADVMRGEETQIAGLLESDPAFSGLVCMPGTHSKWVKVSEGRVTSFKTFLTGELFSLLEDHSILRHSLQTDGFDDVAYGNTVCAALAAGDAALANLFSIRAQNLLLGTTPAVSRANLSANLIASEIGAAQSLFGRHPAVLIGDDELVRLYGIALRAASFVVDPIDGAALTLRGLIVAKALIEDRADA